MDKHSCSQIKWRLPTYREQTSAAKSSLKPTLTQPRLDRYPVVSAAADDVGGNSVVVSALPKLQVLAPRMLSSRREHEAA